MEMPPGPPPLGAPAPPPPPPERYVDAEVVEPGDERRPAGDDEAANRRLVATTAALALLAVALMIAVFLLTDESSSDEPEAGVAPPVTVPTATTAAPDPDIDPAELEALVTEIAAFVEEERGLDFLEDVEYQVVNRTDYETLLGESFDEDLEVLTPYLTQHAAIYQALGVWLPGDDPVARLRELSLQSSLGFYDPRDDQLVIAALELTPLLETVLAHELVHALDDQHFDLDRVDLLELAGEQNLAFSALAEGDAGRIEEAYEATLSDDEQADADAERQALVAELELDSIPPILLYEQELVYSDGRAFVQALVDDGGNEAVDEAFGDPPTTSEEIQEPETYLSGLPPTRVPVPEPDPDGESVIQGTVGQATLDLLASLERPVDEPPPEWNGDSFVLWTRDDDSLCLRALVAGDVAGFQEQLEGWATQRDAELEVVDDRLQITVCG